MTALGAANLAVRFALELAMLAAFAFWGFVVGDSVLARLLLGLGAPMLAIVIWGAFIAPRAGRRVADPIRAALEVVLFGLASVALVFAERPFWGVAMGALAAVNISLMFMFDQRRR